MKPAEHIYMTDLRRLDEMQNGMLDPSILVPDPDSVRDALAARGWVRIGEMCPCGKPACYLTTKGMRALRRYETR